MSRPRDADASATKKKILDVACALCSEKGHGDTGMRDIASHAGVSRATVHHYFGNKAGLYRASIDAMYAELAELENELLQAFNSSAKPEDTLGDIVKRVFRFSRQHQPALRLVMRTVVDKGELEEPIRDQVFLPFLQRGTRSLANIINLPEDKLRIRLMSLNYLVARYALASDRDLLTITKRNNIVDATSFIEGHLLELLRGMLEANSPG